jgi:hypothetical protein
MASATTWVVYRVAGVSECRECGVLEPDEWEQLVSLQADRVLLVRGGFTSENAAERFARSG